MFSGGPETNQNTRFYIYAYLKGKKKKKSKAM